MALRKYSANSSLSVGASGSLGEYCRWYAALNAIQ